MPRQFTPKVVTANALIEGDVIYLTSDDTWTRELAQAEVLTDEAVGVYLADVRLEDGVPQPTHFREDFRRTGPSNYFHGKQAAR